MNEKFKKQMDFIIEIDKLKTIFRQSLISDASRHENDAEHSWHLAMLAVVLEEYAQEETDILKCIKMVLIHDLVEIYAGDTYIYDKEGMKDKKQRELAASEKIYGILDNEQCNELKELWLEFEECETKESIFANILDKIEPVILNYLTKGEMWKRKKITKEQVLSDKISLLNKADNNIKEYIINIINESVEKGYLRE